MRYAIESLFTFVAVLAWLAGAVLAPGWWKLAAFIFPPCAWYFVVERVMQALGWVAA